jgi:hypothetical protein
MKNTLLLSLTSRKRVFAPLVASLFGNGEQGLVIVPSYGPAHFQDAAMTIPAVVGSPVVKSLDLSGRGNTVTWANVTLQQDAAGKKYLAFNGTSSRGATAAIDFTGTAKLTLWAGVHKGSDAATGVLIEGGTGSAANSFCVFAPGSAAGNYYFRALGTSGVDSLSATTYTAPITNVLSCAFDLSADSGAAVTVKPRINGVIPTLATVSDTSATGTMGGWVLNIGARNASSVWMSGRIYGLVVRGAAATAGQIVDGEALMSSLSGV